MKHEICTRCNGKRHVLGMGFIKDDCPVCDGKGFILLEEPKPKKKAGRPKKKVADVKAKETIDC